MLDPGRWFVSLFRRFQRRSKACFDVLDKPGGTEHENTPKRLTIQFLVAFIQMKMKQMLKFSSSFLQSISNGLKKILLLFYFCIISSLLRRGSTFLRKHRTRDWKSIR